MPKSRAISAAEPTPARQVRADAVRNQELLVAAADAAFTEHGADASLDEIARRAGVGIATLYRNFPTRDALLAAVLDGGTAAIVARAEQLLTAPGPLDSLSRWLEALVEYVATYRGLSEVVAAAYAAKGDPLCIGCEAISSAGEALVRRAQAAGELSQDARPKDVIMAAHAAAWVGEQTKDKHAPARLLNTLLAGLRPAAPVSKAKTRTARR